MKAKGNNQRHLLCKSYLYYLFALLSFFSSSVKQLKLIKHVYYILIPELNNLNIRADIEIFYLSACLKLFGYGQSCYEEGIIGFPSNGVTRF